MPPDSEPSPETAQPQDPQHWGWVFVIAVVSLNLFALAMASTGEDTGVAALLLTAILNIVFAVSGVIVSVTRRSEPDFPVGKSITLCLELPACFIIVDLFFHILILKCFPMDE